MGQPQWLKDYPWVNRNKRTIKLGDRKVTPGKDRGTFFFTNSYGEEFQLTHRNGTLYTVEGQIRYYNVADNGESVNPVECEDSSMIINIYCMNENYYVAESVGMIIDYTEIVKNFATGMLAANDYYKKYGYPKNERTV